MLRHLSKSGGTNAIYRGGGSIGIIGAARVGLLAASDPEDDSRRVLAVTKSNLAAIPPAHGYRLVPDDEYDCARVDWLGATDHKAGDLLIDKNTEERTERDEAVEFLRSVLNGGGLPPKEVELQGRAAGFSLDQLKRAKPVAGVRSVKRGFGDGGQWVWELREQDAPTGNAKGSEERSFQNPAPLAPLADSAAPLVDKPDESDTLDLGAWTSDDLGPYTEPGGAKWPRHSAGSGLSIPTGAYTSPRAPAAGSATGRA